MNPVADEELINAERKRIVISSLVERKETVPNLIDNMVRLGDFHVIIRVMAYVLRFVKMKVKGTKSTTLSSSVPNLAVEEIKRAESTIFRYIQQQTWGDRPPTSGFHAKIDGDGVLRIVTRLLNLDDHYDFKCPVLLPGNHQLVKLLIYKEHSLASHAGVQILQARLREKYWIVHSRRSIRNVIHACAICRVHLAKRCEVPQAPLPKKRCQTTRCFEVTGVDLAGPLFLRNGKKAWIVLFTCATYRAVHLEVTPALSTEAFLIALRKFIVRRGRPSTIYSDNATNFHGCNNLLRSVNWGNVEKMTTLEKIQWIFNPPTAAWWGGFWERLVGIMKQLIRRSLGKRTVDLLELEMLVLEVEAVMNDRPLTYLSEDPDDLRPLTPAMFMRDIPVAHLPEIEVTGKELNRRQRYIQRTKEELRKRFRLEYLGQLENMSKSRKVTVLSPGDVVLVELDNRKRLEWPIGVIDKLFPGKDEFTRTARVKTSNGFLLRPLQRLFPLEIRRGDAIDVREAKCEGKHAPPESSYMDCSEDEEDIDVPDENEPVIITRAGRKSKKPDRLQL